ncbi:MAG: hypothetical protein JSR65_14025 [Proteobacteria bacterium]|nr:hypothetical protein [Pseudomonadota bacterium]
MSTITVGVDLAKNVFAVCAVDGAGHVLQRAEFKREAFALWLAEFGVVVAKSDIALRRVLADLDADAQQGRRHP